MARRPRSPTRHATARGRGRIIPRPGGHAPKPKPLCPVWDNGTEGGIGLQLGVLGDGRAIGGIDLDTCRKADGTLEPWAAEVVARIGSYTEISPSGTGAKVFFTFPEAELAWLRVIMGKKPGEGSGRKWARGKDDHVPSIELYLDGGYFALTDQPLPGSPNELRPVTADMLTWLICEARARLRWQRSSQAREEQCRLVP